jgi:hypothetical protein
MIVRASRSVHVNWFGFRLLVLVLVIVRAPRSVHVSWFGFRLLVLVRAPRSVHMLVIVIVFVHRALFNRYRDRLLIARPLILFIVAHCSFSFVNS